ncbi:MAG: hypothetical protein LBL49_03335 [Clostridiales Family XIII bacterium]|jgi:hypothetical protein|nr:hypothetical protein [Clostridiales Family XIII bacterium]
MKDRIFTIPQIIIAALLVIAAVIYVQFVYHPMRDELTSHMGAYHEIEGEKSRIAELMLDPSAEDAKIAGLRSELDALQKVGSVTPATVVGDINSRLRVLEIESAGVSLGDPEISKLGGIDAAAGYSGPLMELPLTIEIDADYESGAGFITSLEQSTEATYIIDDFSCTEISEADGNGNGNGGGSNSSNSSNSNSSNGRSSAGSGNNRGSSNSANNSVGSGNNRGSSNSGGSVNNSVEMKWIMTVRLLYYGDDL